MHYPDNIRIPAAFSVGGLDLDKTGYDVCRIFIPVSRGSVSPTVELEDGVVRIWAKEDLLKILNTKHTFTICPPGIFDSLLKWFKREEIFALDLGVPAWINDNNKLWYRGKSIKVGTKFRAKYLWNLYDFFTFDEPPQDIETMSLYIELLLGYLEKHHLSYSSLASPTAVSRHQLLRHARSEFVMRKLDPVVVEAFFRSAHGGRQESTGIGTKDCYSYDMNKAHLGIFNQMVSIRSCQYRNNFPYIPEANYGTYLITAYVPKMDLCPLPMEITQFDMNSLAYPYGEVNGWYAKPYLDLLTEMGIKFKVHASHQYIPFRETSTDEGDTEPYYPFKEMVHKIRSAMNNAPWYINGKALYYGMAGSTISLRDSIDEETGEVYKGAMPCFSPIIYSHVLASQSARVFREISKGQPIAIRSDAITTDGKTSTALRLESNGPTTFVTPLFKVFPDGRGEEWKWRIESNLDSSNIRIERSEFATIWQYLNHGKRLGSWHETSIRIDPNHGQRDGEVPARVGDLLENWYPSKPRDIKYYAEVRI